MAETLSYARELVGEQSFRLPHREGEVIDHVRPEATRNFLVYWIIPMDEKGVLTQRSFLDIFPVAIPEGLGVDKLPKTVNSPFGEREVIHNFVLLQLFENSCFPAQVENVYTNERTFQVAQFENGVCATLLDSVQT